MLGAARTRETGRGVEVNLGITGQLGFVEATHARVRHPRLPRRILLHPTTERCRRGERCAVALDEFAKLRLVSVRRVGRWQGVEKVVGVAIKVVLPSMRRRIDWQAHRDVALRCSDH